MLHYFLLLTKEICYLKHTQYMNMRALAYLLRHKGNYKLRSKL
jgi:hypothetical protein